MNDYIFKQDAIKIFRESWERYMPHTDRFAVKRSCIVTDLQNVPSADVVNVVKCKECKLRKTEDCPYKQWNYTWAEYEYFECDDAYCSMGERKDNE